MKVRDVLKILEADGWKILRVKGSHRQLRHPSEPDFDDPCWTLRGRGAAWDLGQHLQTGWDQKGGAKVKYLVIIEKGPSGYGAYVPDLPGCVAVADTREEVQALIKEAMELHLQGLREAGEPIPEPSSTGELIEVQAA